MTKEQYKQAAELKAGIKATERKINEANHIICQRKISGVCKTYWIDINNLFWNDPDAKETFDKDIFAALAGYKTKMEKEKEKLEKQFEEL